MNGAFKSRKFWLVACGLWLVACGLFAGNYALSQVSQESTRKNQDGPDVINYNPEQSLFVYSSGLATSIKRKMVINNLTPEQIHLLDFSMPGASAYGDNPQYEIFSNSNQYAAPVLPDKFLRMEDISDDFRYLISLGNRAEGHGTIKTELMAVVPKVRESFCKTLLKNLGQETMPEILKSPNVTPSNQEVSESDIVTLPQKYGCVKSPDGLFWYFTLYER